MFLCYSKSKQCTRFHVDICSSSCCDKHSNNLQSLKVSEGGSYAVLFFASLCSHLQIINHSLYIFLSLAVDSDSLDLKRSIIKAMKYLQHLRPGMFTSVDYNLCKLFHDNFSSMKIDLELANDIASILLHEPHGNLKWLAKVCCIGYKQAFVHWGHTRPY